MSEKINSTVNKLIRDILSYDFPSDELQRQAHIAKVAVLAVHTLSNEFDVENKGININTENEMLDRSDAETNMITKNIEFSPKLFTQRENYGKDIATIGHEIRHYSDFCGKLDNSKLVVGKGSAFNGDMLGDLCIRYWLGTGEYKIRGSIAIPFMERLLISKKANMYCYSKYVLDPIEMNAREFGRKLLQQIIDASDNIDNKTSVETLNMLEIYHNLNEQELANKKKEENAKNEIQNNEDYFLDTVLGARKILMKKDEFNKNALDRTLDKKFNPNDVRMFDSVSDLFVGVMIDYDDEVANALFDTIMKMDKESYNICFEVVSALCMYSQFEPTKAQVDLLYERGSNDGTSIDSLLEMSNRIEPVMD